MDSHSFRGPIHPLTSLIEAARKRTVMDSRDEPISRLARIMFAALMIYTWAGGLQLAPAADAPVAAPGAAPRHADPAQIGRLLERADSYFRMMQAGVGQIPRQSFDPVAVAQDAGKDW